MENTLQSSYAAQVYSKGEMETKTFAEMEGTERIERTEVFEKTNGVERTDKITKEVTYSCGNERDKECVGNNLEKYLIRKKNPKQNTGVGLEQIWKERWTWITGGNKNILR